MIKGNFGENKNKLFLKDFRWNSWRKCMVERERYQPVTLDRKKKKKKVCWDLEYEKGKALYKDLVRKVQKEGKPNVKILDFKNEFGMFEKERNVIKKRKNRICCQWRNRSSSSRKPIHKKFRFYSKCNWQDFEGFKQTSEFHNLDLYLTKFLGMLSTGI